MVVVEIEIEIGGFRAWWDCCRGLLGLESR